MEHHTITYSNVSRETFDQTKRVFSEHHNLLEKYLDQLLWWNKRINLVSRNVPRETILEHLFHSLLIQQLGVFKSAKVILDTGTGGGLPGLPLAIAHSEKKFFLNDIVSKKCLTIKQMVRKLGVQNVRVIDSSINDVKLTKPFLLISKHAFKLNELYKMASNLPWKTMVLYKGKEFKEELKGIKEPLQICSHDLSEAGGFYQGKAIVTIERT